MKRGESQPIQLYLNGKSYEAKLNNNRIADKFGNRADIVHIRYTQHSDLATALRGMFQRSYAYIDALKKLQEPGSKKRIVLPDEYKEYLAVYTTEDDDSYILETISADEVGIMKESVQGKQERLVETEINYEEKDEGAGILINQRLVKIRKLNRLIGENLKLLYGYRCQICGKLIGEEYGSHIVEAHHMSHSDLPLC